jgi:hypothetical protein
VRTNRITFKNLTIIDISVVYLYVVVISGNKQNVSRIGNRSNRRRGKPWKLHSMN